MRSTAQQLVASGLVGFLNQITTTIAALPTQCTKSTLLTGQQGAEFTTWSRYAIHQIQYYTDSSKAKTPQTSLLASKPPNEISIMRLGPRIIK
jgi:hypothetical protein